MTLEKLDAVAKSIPGAPLKECHLLYTLAKQSPKNGVIVEIGSYVGKTTMFIAQGAIDSGEQAVYSIDPHEGTLEHTLPGVPTSTLKQFDANMAAAGVTQRIRHITKLSTAVAPTWKEPIAMIFIDGDHKYEPARNDLKMFEPFLVEGAIVAMHDTVGRIRAKRGTTRTPEIVDKETGAGKAARNHLLLNKHYRHAGLLNSISYARYAPNQKSIPLGNRLTEAKRRLSEFYMALRA